MSEHLPDECLGYYYFVYYGSVSASTISTMISPFSPIAFSLASAR